MRVEQVAIPVMRWITQRPRLADAIFSRMRWGNTFSDENLRDPYIQGRQMLDDGYITYHRGYQQWFALGYDEAREVLHNPSFGTGDRMETLLTVRPYSKLDPATAATMRKWLLFVDPPDHTRLRRLVIRWFTPKTIAALRPRVEGLVAGLIDDIKADLGPDGGTFDLMPALSLPLPINVIGEIMGIPSETWPEMKAISTEIAKVADPFRGFDPDVVDRRNADLTELILAAAEERRRNPSDDLLSALVADAEDGDRLSEEELVAMVGFLMFAGHETTTGGISTALLALAAYPEQRAMLRRWIADGDDDAIDNAIEELLRYDTPVLAIPRTAFVDTEVGGRTIPAGANVVASIAIANRDTRRFADAHELKLDRESPRPLSFGNGIHHCLGAALARLEIRSAVTAFVAEFDDYEIDPLEVEWRQVLTLRTPLTAPIRVRSN